MEDSGVYVNGKEFQYDVGSNYNADSDYFGDKVSVYKYLQSLGPKLKAVLRKGEKTALVLMQGDDGISRFARVCSQGTTDLSAYAEKDTHIILNWLAKRHYMGVVQYGPHVLINKHMHPKKAGKPESIYCGPRRQTREQKWANDAKLLANTSIYDDQQDICPVCYMQRTQTGACDCY